MENEVPCASLGHEKHEINQLPCVFARPLGQRVAVCEYARNCARAKTPATRVMCTQPLARAACAELNGLLVLKSAFVIRRIDVPAGPTATVTTPAPLTAAQLRQIQGGGLCGLRNTLDPAAPAPNVQRLLYAGKLRFGDFSLWPWLEIIKGMASWKPRPLRR